MGKSSKSLRNLFRRRRPTSTSPSVPHPRTTVEDLELVFAKFDTNGDGKISLSELASVFESLSGTPPSEDDLKAAMDEADADKDGFISLPEFVDLNIRGVEPEEALEDIREAFAVFDLDRDGWISAEELEKVLGSLGEGATAAQCRRMIGGVDRDGDGRISFEEFRAMMAAGSSFASSSEVSIRKVKD